MGHLKKYYHLIKINNKYIIQAIIIKVNNFLISLQNFFMMIILEFILQLITNKEKKIFIIDRNLNFIIKYNI
jgi:hypothetical protein